jgi:hypothetical protein
VTQHLVRPDSWLLFSSAAMESGAFALWSAKNMTLAQRTFGAVASAAGCGDEAGGKAGSSGGGSGNGNGTAAAVDCLLGLDASALVAAQLTVGPVVNGAYLPFSPVVDGVEATTHPWLVLADAPSSGVADVPLLLGMHSHSERRCASGTRGHTARRW